MRLLTLGDAAVETAEGRLDASSPTLFLAACYLATQAGRRVPRETLMELLWPDIDGATARHRLRTLLHRLKRAGVPLEVTTADIRLLSRDVERDYHELGNPASLVANLALSEHVGVILPFSAPVSRGLEEWMDDWRREIGREVSRGIVGALQLARDRGDWATVERLAESCRAVDPFNEEAHLALAEALCMTGSKERALKLLDAYVAEVGGERQLRIPVRLLRERLAAIADRPDTPLETPFVGRGELRRVLAESFTQTGRGQGGARVIWGPAGIGKSRLLGESIRDVRLRGGVVASITSEPGDRLRPLSALFDLVPRLLELPGALGSAPWVLDELKALEITLQDSGSAVDAESNPSARRKRTQAALLELLDAVSSEQPLVITVEDAQWLDPGLLPYWENLLRWSRSHSVLWLFTCRAESIDEVLRLGFGDLAPGLQVTTLDRDTSRVLVAGLSANTIPETLQAELADLGAGNPWVISELVRHYLDTGGVNELPVSVTALIGERLDRLSRVSERVLQAAAILGAFATMDRIEAMLALPRPEFIDAVYELAGAGIVTGDAADRLRAHALWSEAALGRLQPVVAGMLHRHAGERLEVELVEVPRVQLLWECARHWLAAGDAPRTLSALTRGADHLAERGYTQDAAIVYGRAVELSQDPSERLRLLRREIDLLVVCGHWPDAITAIDAHELLAADLDPTYDRHSALELLRQNGEGYISGDLAAAGRAALACAQAVRATASHRLHAAKNCAYASENTRQSDDLIAVERIVGELPVASIEDRRMRRTVRMLYHQAIGDQHVAAALSRERIRHERASGDLRQLCRGLRASFDGILLSGAVDEAWAVVREVESIASRHGFIEDLKSAYDDLISLSFAFEGPDSVRRWVAKMWQVVEAQDDHIWRTVFLPMIETQLALVEGDGERARLVVPPLETVLALPVPRWRTRIRAMHLGVAVQTGNDAAAHRMAEELSGAFDRPDRFLDWPATIYVSYLIKYGRRVEAIAFATRFIAEVRRELYPPPPTLGELASASPDEIIARV